MFGHDSLLPLIALILLPVEKSQKMVCRRYWDRVGGTLVEECPGVHQGLGKGLRLVDAINLLQWSNEARVWREVDLSGKTGLRVRPKIIGGDCTLWVGGVLGGACEEKFPTKVSKTCSILMLG